MIGSTVVIIDLQHRGKAPPNQADVGASRDIDGDGKIGPHEVETHLVPGYAGPCNEVLFGAGHQVVWFTDGSYSDRHKRAAKIAGSVGPTGRVAYLACHLNAGAEGKLQRALTLYDARSGSGKTLATSIASALNHVDALRRGRGSHVFAARDSDWTRRPLNTIRGIYSAPSNISGVCLEPLFLDGFPAPTWALLAEVGEHLGQGIDAWLRRDIGT